MHRCALPQSSDMMLDRTLWRRLRQPPCQSNCDTVILLPSDSSMANTESAKRRTAAGRTPPEPLATAPGVGIQASGCAGPLALAGRPCGLDHGRRPMRFRRHRLPPFRRFGTPCRRCTIAAARSTVRRQRRRRRVRCSPGPGGAGLCRRAPSSAPDGGAACTMPLLAEPHHEARSERADVEPDSEDESIGGLSSSSGRSLTLHRVTSLDISAGPFQSPNLRRV
jgi:hypothetical protein